MVTFTSALGLAAPNATAHATSTVPKQSPPLYPASMMVPLALLAKVLSPLP